MPLACTKAPFPVEVSRAASWFSSALNGVAHKHWLVEKVPVAKFHWITSS